MIIIIIIYHSCIALFSYIKIKYIKDKNLWLINGAYDRVSGVVSYTNR